MAMLNEIRGLAEYEAKAVTSSPRDWMKYLDTAAKLYRYSFPDVLLIHAQRPDATACASLELWNEKMNRWVNRGAKGIALIDDTGPTRRLRYVFDISDTHMGRGGRTPNLWRIEAAQKGAVLDHLADVYGLSEVDAADLPFALSEISRQLTEENLEEAMEGLLYETEGTFLEGLDEDTIRVEFRRLLMNSAFYTLAVRCGLDQSVIFCGQFNTYLSFSFPAPTFSLNPTLPLYLLGANRTILRYARAGDIFNTAHRTILRL